MGKRKYLNEQDELQFMVDFFEKSIHKIYVKQHMKWTGDYVEYENQKKFQRLVSCLNNFIDPETCSDFLKERIDNYINSFDSSFFKFKKMEDLFKQFIDKLVEYCWTRKINTKEKWHFKKYEKYSELNDAFYKWTKYIEFLNAKIFFQNVKATIVTAKTKLAKAFTR